MLCVGSIRDLWVGSEPAFRNKVNLWYTRKWLIDNLFYEQDFLNWTYSMCRNVCTIITIFGINITIFRINITIFGINITIFGRKITIFLMDKNCWNKTSLKPMCRNTRAIHRVSHAESRAKNASYSQKIPWILRQNVDFTPFYRAWGIHVLTSLARLKHSIMIICDENIWETYWNDPHEPWSCAVRLEGALCIHRWNILNKSGNYFILTRRYIFPSKLHIIVYMIFIHILTS